MAPACLAQSKNLWSCSSTFSTWEKKNSACNICCCLLTALLQCAFHAPSQKSIPRQCVQGVSCFQLFLWTVFSVMFLWCLQSSAAMSRCVGCEKRERSWCSFYKEAEARSCFAQICQCQAVMGAARNACSKANQFSEALRQQSLINPRPHFS